MSISVFIPKRPDLSIKFCWNLLLPKQVCLIIGCGSGSCQLWSVCVTRGKHACWVQLLQPASYPWRGAHLAVYIHTCGWTHTWYKHTCSCCQSRWVETGSRPGGPPEQQNKPNIQSQKRKKEVKARFRGVPKQFMPSFTFNSPSPKGVIYISTLGETSGSYSGLHNYSLIHAHNTLHMLCNPLALHTN